MRARYWTGGLWVGKSRTDVQVQPIPTEPPRRWQEASDPALRPFAVIRSARVLGGHGLNAPRGVVVEVAFFASAISLRSAIGSELSAIPYSEVVALEIGGPGAKRSGGGFIGGGFGVEGAAEGMLIASALNMLTTKTTINTVVCLQTRSAELFLHCTDETPDAMRIRLSQVFNILRSQSAGASPFGNTSTQGDVVDRLAQLGQMHERGLLTLDEFNSLKQSLLNRDQSA